MTQPDIEQGAVQYQRFADLKQTRWERLKEAVWLTYWMIRYGRK